MAIQHFLKRGGVEYKAAYTKITSVHWHSNNPEKVQLEYSTWENERDRTDGKAALEFGNFVMVIDTNLEEWAMKLSIELGYREMRRHSHFEQPEDV